LPADQLINGDLGEASPHGDGFYWRVLFRMTDAEGNVVVTTDPENPIVARDDSGAGPFISSPDLYFLFNAPETILREGRGFGYRIAHRVLTKEANALNKWYFKFLGIDMPWKEFTPVFFLENDNADEMDLSRLTTFGWKPAAALGEDGVGFLTKGYHRYAAASKKAATGCVEKIFQ